jgi:hypothetical protein
LPKSNRPLVRDGRIQAPKKRTDRSYLRPTSDALGAAPAPDDDAEIDEMADAAEGAATAAAPIAAFAPPAAPSFAAAPKQVSSKLPTTVRAIQQQGVRKRGDVDLSALAKRDTSYAYHELRRIAVLATMVIVTLVVLWVVLR